MSCYKIIQCKIDYAENAKIIFAAKLCVHGTSISIMSVALSCVLYSYCECLTRLRYHINTLNKIMMMIVDKTDKKILTKDSTSEILPRTLATPTFPDALAHLLYSNNYDNKMHVQR